jgi:hypothetical protein
MFEALANYIRWALEMIQLGNILRRKSNIFNIKVEHHSRIRTIGDPNLSPIPYRSVPYRTVAYRTVAYRTVAYRTGPYRTVPYRTVPYRFPLQFLSRSRSLSAKRSVFSA